MQNRLVYWNVIGAEMGIVGVGRSEELRRGSSECALLNVMEIGIAEDVKERVNDINKKLYDKYKRQETLERAGQTPPWNFYERAKELFGPIKRL